MKRPTMKDVTLALFERLEGYEYFLPLEDEYSDDHYAYDFIQICINALSYCSINNVEVTPERIIYNKAE